MGRSFAGSPRIRVEYSTRVTPLTMNRESNQVASNYAIFCDCFSSAIFQRSHRTIPKSPKRRVAKGGKKVTKPSQLQSERHDDSAEEMAEFSEVQRR